MQHSKLNGLTTGPEHVYTHTLHMYIYIRIVIIIVYMFSVLKYAYGFAFDFLKTSERDTQSDTYKAQLILTK